MTEVLFLKSTGMRDAIPTNNAVFLNIVEKLLTQPPRPPTLFSTFWLQFFLTDCVKYTLKFGQFYPQGDVLCQFMSILCQFHADMFTMMMFLIQITFMMIVMRKTKMVLPSGGKF